MASVETRFVGAVRQANYEHATNAGEQMTPAELRKACRDSPYHFVLLNIPRRAQSMRIRLLRDAGPWGKVGNVRDDGVTFARFDKTELLAWLDEMECEACPRN